MVPDLVLISARADGPSLRFSAYERPHADGLDPYHTTITGLGLTATCGHESVGGDDLGRWLSELGAGPLWSGSSGWRSWDGSLNATVTVDGAGHVDLTITQRWLPWRDEWSALLKLEYPLGDLVAIGESVRDWFTSQY